MRHQLSILAPDPDSDERLELLTNLLTDSSGGSMIAVLALVREGASMAYEIKVLDLIDIEVEASFLVLAHKIGRASCRERV